MPQLIEALEDEFLYVRIFAAGALGSIGPKAQTAREALTAAAHDPALRERSRVGVESNRGHRVWRACRLTACARAFRRASTARRRWRKRAILRLTGIRPPGGTSSGVSSWETRRLAVPWLPAMRSMWAPTTPGT